MYAWIRMDAGGLNHKDCILSFCSKLNALKVCSQQFFYLGTRKVLFFVECEVYLKSTCSRLGRMESHATESRSCN